MDGIGWALLAAVAVAGGVFGLNLLYWDRETPRERNLARLALVDEEGQRALLAYACRHCGAINHDGNCPRVKRIRFRIDGETPVEVEYWPSSEWLRGDELWPADLHLPAADEAAARVTREQSPRQVKVITG